MSSFHTRGTISSIALLAGALLVGDALHGSVVTGAYGVLSPASVFRFVGGGVLLFVGTRFQLSPEDAEEMFRDNPEGVEDADGEFDPELSPIGDPSEPLASDDADDDGS